MKKYILFIIMMIAAITIPVACSSSDENRGPEPDTVTSEPAGPTDIPTSAPTESPSPSPSPSPTPLPTPTPTPIPEIKDIWEETEEPNVYSLPDMDINALYLSTVYSEGKLLYFFNEGYSTSPEIISYDYQTGEKARMTIRDIEANDYRFYVVPGKYIVVSDSAKRLIYYDLDLKELLNTEIPIKSNYPEFWHDDTFENIYYVNADELIKFDPFSGETTTIKKDSRYKECYPANMTADGKYLKVYIYSWRKGYSEVYLADVNTGELLRSDDAKDYTIDYFLSPDQKEILMMDGDKNNICLYDVDINDTELLFKLDQNITDGLAEPKATAVLNSYYDLIHREIDWENRKLITNAKYTIGDCTILELKCFDIDTGDLISSTVIDIESQVTTDYTLSMDREDGYLIVSGNANSDPLCYAWDYLNDEVNTSSADFKRINYIPDYLDKHRKELEEKYNMYIYLGSEVFATSTDYLLTCCKSPYEMDKALYIVDEVLSLYPEGFFEQIKYGGIKTIGLYLCSGFTKNSSYGIDTAIALAGTDGYERFLVLDISYPSDLRRNIIHEISHWTDNRINQQDYVDDVDFEEEWSKLNPEDFYYMNDYNKTSPFYRYTYSSAKEKAYFVDSYAMSKATEDRARLFEYLMRFDKEYDNEYMQSEAMRKKLHFYFDNIRRCFDTTDWPEETIWEHKLEMLDRFYNGDEGISYETIYPEMFGDEKTYETVDDRWYLDAYAGGIHAYG